MTVKPTFETDLAYSWTARRIRDYMLAYPGTDGDLAERFALACVDLIEERDAYREALHCAIGREFDQNTEIRRLHDRIAQLQDERRRARPSQERAA